jgi:hypothetical protein
MVNSTSQNQGSKSVPHMNGVGYIIAIGIFIFLLPLLPVFILMYILNVFRAK